MNALNRFFKIKEQGSNIRTEILAGITTFMTMAYILAVNPQVLSSAGMDAGAVFVATCIASFIANFCMAFFANYPFVLAPGVGLGAFFAYTVVLKMGYSWNEALAAVFIAGVIFIILTLVKVREAIYNAIPDNLKHAIPAGVGLFITFIGFQHAGIVTGNSSTLVSMFSFSQAIENGTMNTEGIKALLALAGILITAILLLKKVKVAILLGILITWGMGMICQLAGLYIPDGSAHLSMFPQINGFNIPSIEPVFMKMDFSGILSFNFLIVVLSFLFVDMFDTIGNLIGIVSQTNMLDKNGNLPRMKGALLSDAVGTTVGAACGTSTVTTYVESATGVSQGGRTGLTAITSGLLFLAAIFLSPIFLSIPIYSTTPALIVIGFLMMSSVLKVDFKDPSQGIPAFLTIMGTPFFYSIADGISLGLVSYAVIDIFKRVINRNKDEKQKINIVMYVLAVFMILKYIFI